MIVTRVKAKNWRNLREVDTPLEERVFAVGPNAGGKSNFLDIFHFMADLVRPGGGLFVGVEERGGVTGIRCRAGEGCAFELSLTLGTPGKNPADWTYAIGVQPCGPRDSRPVLLYERVWKKGRKILDRPDARDRRDPVRLEETFLQNVTTNAPFRPVAEFFGKIAYRHLFPRKAIEGTRPGAGLSARHPFDRSASSFIEEMMETPLRTRKARIAKIEAALKLVIPQLKTLSLANLNESRPRLKTHFHHWRAGEAETQEHFSDGTLRLISILWALLANESILLLEEPELSLHPSVVRHLSGLIYRLKRKNRGQVILTTHSVELLSDAGIDSREVLLFLPAEAGGAEVAVAADLPDVEALVKEGLPIGDIVLPRSQPSRIQELGFFK